MSASEFTHLDPLGRARMVDVTAKDATHRRAVARCRIYMEAETASKIASGAITKGDVLSVARVAGIGDRLIGQEIGPRGLVGPEREQLQLDVGMLHLGRRADMRLGMHRRRGQPAAPGEEILEAFAGEAEGIVADIVAGHINQSAVCRRRMFVQVLADLFRCSDQRDAVFLQLRARADP